MKKLSVRYTIPCKLEIAYPYFLHLEKFGSIHPYMVEVKRLDGATFAIKEKLMLYGFLPMSPSYNAEVIEVRPGKEISYTSQVKKGIDLSIRFIFTENAANNGCSIEETIEVKANPIIARMFLNLIKKAHEITFKNLAIATKNN